MTNLTIEENSREGTILVVEDDAGLLRLIGKNLGRLGYTTELYASEIEAMERILAEPPQLLMLDYQLGTMTGKEFLETLSRKCALPPFIIMTGHGNESIAVKMMKLGAIDYLIKDHVFLDLLPAVVEQAISNINTQQKLKKLEKEKAGLQEQLRQSQKMEAIGTLAGGIAHDFNNILAVILGYAELAQGHIDDANPAQPMLTEIINASLRAKNLVRQILDFSRKSEMSQIPLQIHSLVKEGIKLMRVSIPSIIEIKHDIHPDCGQILADPTQMHQVLMNLCTNAFQSMENGGVLEVTLDCVTLTAEEVSKEAGVSPGPYVRLKVSDSGSGMDAATQERIFEPYFTTKGIGKGSGMGLAVIHGVVKRHGGMIRVESIPGRGSTFSVYLPQIAPVPETKLIDKGDNLSLAGNERILIVDDDQVIVTMLKQVFTKLGYQVRAETESLKALELMRTNPQSFDLVITDQTMPQMTGERLAKELLALRPDLPIVLCTGFSTMVDETQAAGMGIKAFVMKPYGNKEIARTVRQVLNSNGHARKHPRPRQATDTQQIPPK